MYLLQESFHSCKASVDLPLPDCRPKEPKSRAQNRDLKPDPASNSGAAALLSRLQAYSKLEVQLHRPCQRSEPSCLVPLSKTFLSVSGASTIEFQAPQLVQAPQPATEILAAFITHVNWDFFAIASTPCASIGHSFDKWYNLQVFSQLSVFGIRHKQPEMTLTEQF